MTDVDEKIALLPDSSVNFKPSSKNDDKRLQIDDILVEIGGFGRFQWGLTFLLGCLWTIGGIAIMNMNFIAQKDPKTGELLPGTVAATFDLVGPREWIISVSNSIFFGGWWLGVIVHGYLIDVYGRKRIMAISMIFALIFLITISLASNLWAYITLRAVSAFFIGGCGISDWVLAAEFWPPKWRAITGVLFQAFWASGVLLVPVVVVILPNWRWYQAITALPFLIPYIPYIWNRIPESPRFLIVSGRLDQAMKSLELVARVNRCQLPHNVTDSSIRIHVEEKSRLRDLFGNDKMRLRAIINAYAWLATSFAYYALTLLAGTMTGDIFVNTLLTGAIEIPAYVVAAVLVKFGSTRNGSIVFLSVSAICCLSSIFNPPSNWLVVLATFGKFGSAGAFACLYVYSIELFPTRIRSLGTGVASQGARLGGMLAPLVLLLPSNLIIFGISGGLAAVVLLFLPNTRHEKLSDGVE